MPATATETTIRHLCYECGLASSQPRGSAGKRHRCPQCGALAIIRGEAEKPPEPRATKPRAIETAKPAPPPTKQLASGDHGSWAGFGEFFLALLVVGFAGFTIFVTFAMSLPPAYGEPTIRDTIAANGDVGRAIIFWAIVLTGLLIAHHLANIHHELRLANRRPRDDQP